MRYAVYKPMEELWLTTIPSHWSARKIKYIFSERSEKGFPNEPLLVASQRMGVVPKDIYGDRTVEATKDLHLLKLVRIGDFVISLRSFQGGLEYAHFQGIISPAYTVIVPNEQIASGYFKYLAKSRLFIELLQMCVTGIREGQNINYAKLRNHQIPVPPLEEQDQIVRYLDWQVSKISKIISAKRKRVKTLFEIIQLNLYSEKGENYSIGSFDSAFPMGWETEKARHIFHERAEKGFTDRELLAVTQDRGVLYKKDCTQNYVMPNDVSTQKLVLAGDYIISLRSFQGGIETSELTGLVSAEYSVFYLDKEYLQYAEYYALLFKSTPFIAYLNSLVKDIRDGKKISYNDFHQCTLPLPPKSVLNKVHELKKRYDILRADYEKTRTLLVELRTRLISDVVTGQFDVRGIEVPEFQYIADEAGNEVEGADVEDVENEEE